MAPPHRRRKQQYHRRHPPKRPREQTRTSSNTDNDVLEQLAKQREKQRQQEDASKTKNTTEQQHDPPSVLGRYSYDEDRKAYFPSNEIRRKVVEESVEVSPSFDLRAVTLPHLFHLRHSCTSIAKRRRFAWQAASKILFHSINIVPNTSEKGSCYFQNNFDDDIACKLHSPRWTRTFDVSASAVASRNGNVVTVWAPGKETYVGPEAKQVRFLKDGRLGAVSNTVSNQGNQFYLLRDDGDRFLQFWQLPFLFNDFCDLPEGPGVVFAASKPDNVHGLAGLAGIAWNGEYLKIGVELSCSERLCIDQDKAGGVAIGHRNGDLSLVDIRSRRSRTAKQDFGPVTSLNYVSPTTLLSRSYSGIVLLHDLRSLSSNTAGSSIVYDFSVPVGQRNKRLSAKCSGIAVDSTGTTILSPFVDQHDLPNLATWSLHTGDFVGCKALAHDDDRTPTSHTCGISWVELSPTLTAGRRWTNGDDCCSLDERPNSCGFWYKCGQTTRTSSGGSSIHHVSLKSLEEVAQT